MTFYLNTQLTVRHDNRLKCTAHGASWQAIQMHSSRCVMTGHLRAQLFTSAHCYSHQHQWRKGRPRGAGGVTPWGGAPAERQQYTPQCGAPSMRRPPMRRPPMWRSPNVGLLQCGALPNAAPPHPPRRRPPNWQGWGGGVGGTGRRPKSRGEALRFCVTPLISTLLSTSAHGYPHQHTSIHINTWLFASAHGYPHQHMAIHISTW